MKRLFEYGENSIVQDLIYNEFPHLRNIHGDVVNILTNEYSSFSFSTDPCPEPIVSYFDKENKYYHYGFLSVVINYSDLAACGSTPIGILLSTVMPNDMSDDEYKHFLKGVKDACRLYGGNLLGGNIKDGKNFSVTGTAIGGHREQKVLSRIGLAVGDVICTIGTLGMFWLGILQLIDGSKLEEIDNYTKSFLLQPRPKLIEGLMLAESGMVTSCMDNSDGIIGCLYELASINNISIVIQDEKLIPNVDLKRYCCKKGIDYRNLMLSFGGWDLVFSCKRQNVPLLKKIFKDGNSYFDVIGYTVNEKKQK